MDRKLSATLLGEGFGWTTLSGPIITSTVTAQSMLAPGGQFLLGLPANFWTPNQYYNVN